MRSIFLVCVVWCMACGSDPSPGPGAADGGDAGADAATDAPRGVTSRCGATQLDCDGDGICDTRRDDANCRGCGLACPTGEVCLTGLCSR